MNNSGAKIEQNKITNNHSATAGDTSAAWIGIFTMDNDGNDIVIRDNEISHNTANGPMGLGAVLLASKATGWFENNHVHHNVTNASSCWSGGLSVFGVENKQGPDIIRNNIISHNTLNGSINATGGGMVIENSSPIVTNNIISGNVSSGTSGRGGGIWVLKSGASSGVPEPLLINNTITNNSATSEGGGIRVTGSSADAKVMNTIVWGNSAPTGPQIYISSSADSIAVRYSNVQGGWPGTGNIDLDPQFENQTNCYLTNASPCIDKGDPDPSYNDPEDPTNTGFALWPAMGGLRNDMGAYGGPGSSVLGPIVGIGELPLSAEGLPNRFQLLQNYPNPFNPETNIGFRVSDFGFVTLTIYNVAGEKVATLVSENLAAGSYQYQWEARGLASGVYFYKLEAEGFVQTKKMLLIR